MKLKDLSEILGLSPTTVSRALDGYPEVAEATRKRVREAAARHGYHPNSRARRLATGRAMAVGHVLGLSDAGEMVNPIFSDFIAGAGETYAAAGYDMQISVAADDDWAASYRELAAKGKVDGVILHATRADDERVGFLTDLGLPFVAHGRARWEQGYAWLDIDNRRSFAAATTHLIDLGHRRIALINGREAFCFALRRREGFEAALNARGLGADPALTASGDMTEGAGWRAAAAMLALPEPPTAFLVSSMITALGLRRACEERGMKPGRDVSIIVHDDDLSYFRNEGDPPMFTATRSPVRAAGRRAAEMLLEMIAAPGEVKTELWECDFVIGQSTGPGPEAAT